MAELIGPQWINALFSVSLTALILSLLFVALRMFLNSDEKKLVEKLKKIGHSVITEKIYIDETTWHPATYKMKGSFKRVLEDTTEIYDEMDTLPLGEKPHIEVKYTLSASYLPKKTGAFIEKRVARVNLSILNKQMFD